MILSVDVAPFFKYGEAVLYISISPLSGTKLPQSFHSQLADLNFFSPFAIASSVGVNSFGCSISAAFCSDFVNPSGITILLGFTIFQTDGSFSPITQGAFFIDLAIVDGIAVSFSSIPPGANNDVANEATRPVLYQELSLSTLPTASFDS